MRGVDRHRIRVNGQKLEDRKFHTNAQKTFPVRMTELWNKLPKERMESPPLEIVKTHLKCLHVLPIGVNLLLAGGELNDLQRSPAPPMIPLCTKLGFAQNPLPATPNPLKTNENIWGLFSAKLPTFSTRAQALCRWN